MNKNILPFAQLMCKFAVQSRNTSSGGTRSRSFKIKSKQKSFTIDDGPAWGLKVIIWDLSIYKFLNP
ncbi:hypothetical protein GWI33_020168 [Rhynchophorus ferrugineus]|uniref:Uncharacterized protein n=1 Tax=Rhynchophorus ferrugineus TaxID=354439 RepID=A0A834HWV7_RHYFE|nr:hypothetical protein GWI33_020168 [Rhynchophorus ferrugineus]